jgi:hypothetical protein
MKTIDDIKQAQHAAWERHVQEFPNWSYTGAGLKREATDEYRRYLAEALGVEVLEACPRPGLYVHDGDPVLIDKDEQVRWIGAVGEHLQVEWRALCDKHTVKPARMVIDEGSPAPTVIGWGDRNRVDDLPVETVLLARSPMGVRRVLEKWREGWMAMSAYDNGLRLGESTIADKLCYPLTVLYYPGEVDQ